MHGRDENSILIGKSEEKGPRHGSEDSIKMILKDIWCNCVYWIHLAQDRVQWRDLVNLEMKL
jgi:hypothetical protein